tara:strand:+ start:568 stop:789 length:222 start_codon:yes stop_codon:yes gene_type:complete
VRVYLLQVHAERVHLVDRHRVLAHLLARQRARLHAQLAVLGLEARGQRAQVANVDRQPLEQHARVPARAWTCI